MSKAMISHILIFTAIIGIGLTLQLEGLSTKKPRLTKYTMKPTVESGPDEEASLSTYRINNTNGATCILIRTDALLSISYRDTFGADRELNVYLPDHPQLSGTCEDDQSSITLKAYDIVVEIDFKKTPGGERWYISYVEVSYSSSNPKFEHIDRPGLKVKLSTPPNTLLFGTPVGKSYTCEDKVITMFSQDENDKSGHLAKLYLRQTRMQSFMFKAANTWGPTFQCSATGTYRDETAPIAVGSALAIVTLCSVTAYGIWRYMKIKNVQYGAME
ncbi:Lysosome-associated membrane glycoprotein 5 [Pseudolycoriella hygida]|uniref:Lysosome-associated membrane glycoprotein 5 n=1 Tax=Pseudolycoriella hygida TaxID=35572 RepID=A0A9Q0MP73_9DIPT|nr:Lysosome-associated membrane glycoprotein 5 [Pseudolycoriella hygida]